ncbi:TonB-dependent receptor domain-containing protein [Oceanobacter mangrovi]|uniref:TonB-dependent receptor domain-containing protein n=1 Tax=Oceanobacter mangrovi TaxID=2862510 RepID=UPI001C8E199B|nr:TonB-dependent receptor [Oceanobacter mangrovi]
MMAGNPLGKFARSKLFLVTTSFCVGGVPVALAAPDKDDVEEIVVTAAGHAQEVIDAPASITVISAEELRKKSYSSIVDAVKDIPGVYVNGGGNMQDITIRGMDDAYTLYLVDGRPISSGRNVNTNGTDGGKQIGMPPLSMIERIEVIRGPMSSLYGSEAMGGVVNVITRVAPEQWGGSIAADYTKSVNDISNDEYNTDLYLGGPLIDGKLGLELTGSFQHTDESDYAGEDDSAASNPDSSTRSLGGRLNWQVDDSNRLGISYDRSKQRYTHTPGKSLAEDDDKTSYEYEKVMQAVTHSGYYGNLIVESYLQQDTSDKVQTSDKQEKIITLNSQATYMGENHTYTFGGRYKHEELVNETNGLLSASVDGAVDTMDRWIGAVFTEVEWRFIENLGITTGLRYDDDEFFGGHFSPRVYANWRATDELTVKGGISTGYSQPSLPNATEGFGQGTGGSGSPNVTADGTSIARALIIGNPDLDPETSVNYEFGLIFNNDIVNTSMTVFQTTFKNKIAEDRLCESSDTVGRNDYTDYECEYGGNNYYFLSTYRNISEAEMHGVELSLNSWLSDSVEFNGSYTYTDSEQKTGDYKGQPLNKIPKQMANVSLDWYAMYDVNVWGRVNYRGETSDYLSRTSMSDGTPAYTVGDIGATWQPTEQLRLIGGVYNVANVEITSDSYGVVLDGRRINLGATYDF